MEYERKSISKDDELAVVTGLITSSEFTKQVIPLYKKEYFTLNYTKIVSGWCVDYFKKYDNAIGLDIMAVFDSEKSGIRDQAVADSIETFLLNLNERYEQSESYNVEYNVDKAVKFFKIGALDIMINQVTMAKLSGSLEVAESAIANFKRVEKSGGEATSVWGDEQEAMRAVREDDNDDIMVRFPGDLGKVIRPLTRDDYIAFIAPAKKKKSFWLVETSILASLNKKNVLFVTLEMPTRQLRKRIYQRVTGTVVSDYHNENEGCEVSVPYFDSQWASNGRIIKRKEQKKYISTRAVLKKMKNISSLVKSDNFRIMGFPSKSLTVKDLERHLDNLEHFDDWTPDVIVLDYADILATESRGDSRDQINDKWEELRRLHQQRKIMMVTVSHTNKLSMARDVREEDVVEDVRKLNHVTMCIGINQNDKDKEVGVQRLSVLIDRFHEIIPSKEAVVTQSLEFGGICLDSRVQYKGGDK